MLPSLDAGSYATLIAAILAVAVGVTVYGLGRKMVALPIDIQYLDVLTAGGIPDSSVVMIVGDSGSGERVLARAFVEKNLRADRKAVVISYEADAEDFVGEIEKTRNLFSSAMKESKLVYIDCYSPIARKAEGGLLKDPYNLTYVDVAVRSTLENLSQSSAFVLLVSAAPLFTRLEAKTVISFIQEVGAKTKARSGVFVFTIPSGIISRQDMTRLESMVDGVLETKLIRKWGRTRRFVRVRWLKVKKLSDLHIRFDYSSKKGVTFYVPPK